MLYESILTLRGSVGLSEKSSLNLAGDGPESSKLGLLGFGPNLVPTCRPTPMQNSSYREARDPRLAPSDASYIIRPRKIRRSKIELDAGGKPSTWLPPGRLVEHSTDNYFNPLDFARCPHMSKQTNKQTNKRTNARTNERTNE